MPLLPPRKSSYPKKVKNYSDNFPPKKFGNFVECKLAVEFFFLCRKLEHVVVTIVELEANRRGDVRLELTSPAKTEVIILKESRYDISWEGFKDQRILSLVQSFLSFSYQNYIFCFIKGYLG